MDVDLRQKFEFLCQINELEAAMALLHTLNAMGIELQPSDREHLRFVFAVLRDRVRKVSDRVDDLPSQHDETLEMYDRVMEDVTPFGSLQHEHRLHITIQYIVAPMHWHVAADSTARFVMPLDYRTLLSPYMEPSVPDAVRQHAACFRKAVGRVLKATGPALVELKDLCIKYPVLSFQRNTIRFLNRAEDHLLGGDAIDDTLNDTNGRTCLAPVELFMLPDTRYSNNWMALDESMNSLPGAMLYVTPAAEAPPVKPEPREI
ncbi:hypothetical protein SPRG_21084 [Saprolegnia parasitica CBS 223.65]|uniref:Uncharacterized protein n=1 Tax=Saprolegnia parasitica (strain CBS 223.65) TaxID=695850 RepID=A0A067BU97_SAPPC|nr:hypothetical protein SPRG_21084 [Saprolegnia parasitica CBS 223.65]KDO22099.1 hypothetical protein SPRG_21084 [Saprolegnia parasitica CBS 223.65]|eukprot:XP_012207245.1 hypothetical protein SPRG_21084 [Saprolegnia parasitica CBS 223.65]